MSLEIFVGLIFGFGGGVFFCVIKNSVERGAETTRKLHLAEALAEEAKCSISAAYEEVNKTITYNEHLDNLKGIQKK